MSGVIMCVREGASKIVRLSLVTAVFKLITEQCARATCSIRLCCDAVFSSLLVGRTVVVVVVKNPKSNNTIAWKMHEEWCFAYRIDSSGMENRHRHCLLPLLATAASQMCLCRIDTHRYFIIDAS